MTYKELISVENLFLCWDEFRRGKLKKPDGLLYHYTTEDERVQLYDKLDSAAGQPEEDKTNNVLYFSFEVARLARSRNVPESEVRDFENKALVAASLYDSLLEVILADNQGALDAAEKSFLTRRSELENLP